MPTASVALLRGINVGGKNLLPMKDLCGIFTDAGCVDVKTYIQSGNVVFRAEPAVLKNIATHATARIAERFGFQSPIILRTHEELRDTVANNPFLSAAPDEKSLHVMFLDGAPGAEHVCQLDPHRSPPDRFLVRRRDIYLYLPNGAGKTKLTNAWFDSKLKVTGTGRNWRTVLKLFELTCPE